MAPAGTAAAEALRAAIKGKISEAQLAGSLISAGGFAPLTQINAADPPFAQRSIMRGITRVDLEALAELREVAVRVCEETKILIEESRRLREWAKWFSPQVKAADPDNPTRL